MRVEGRSDLDPLGLTCPRCGAHFTGYQDFNDLRFMCINGHFVSASELLTSPSADLVKQLEALLGGWEKKARDLKRIEVDARDRGRLDVAQVFRRNIDNLETRIRSLRCDLENAFPKPPVGADPAPPAGELGPAGGV